MKYFSSFKQRLIYVMRIDDKAHRGCLKIGETTCDEQNPENLAPNSSTLNEAAHERIRQYTQTAGICYEVLHTECALHKDGKTAFNDYDVHNVLLRSGINKKVFDAKHRANEWFVTDLETVKRAIAAVKEGRQSLQSSEVTQDRTPIAFRPEQREAIEKTIKRFKKDNRMLWNAKMRFGKTLSALQVVREMDFKRTIIYTHRPAVNDGWYDDFSKIFYDKKNYAYGSHEKGERHQILEQNAQEGLHYVYFASMQDLRGSDLVGGKFDKNAEIFATDWDFVVIDEAHEGTQTALGQNVRKALVKPNSKVLELSGTPFNLLHDYKDDEIYTWDYMMEQRAKQDWDNTHRGDPNPYAGLPAMNIYTYDLGRLLQEFADDDVAFNFREFFRTDAAGNFVHKKDITAFLNLITKEDENNCYPYATKEYRENFRHTLWMVPGVKEAKALSALLKQHLVFTNFEVVNVAGNGDEEQDSKNALQAVKDAIAENPYTITISCGRLTTGVSVPEWTAVFMLVGSYSTSASSYMQTIFRVQTPATINGRVKEQCYVFDFAPDRTLRVLAEVAKVSAKAGKTSGEDRKHLGEFLNFCPVIAVEGSEMKEYDVNAMLDQLKKAYIERVVRNGFEDDSLYSRDELFKLDGLELKQFEKLKQIIGETPAMPKTDHIDINKQGLTNEEYEELEEKKKKKKKELSPEEKMRIEELKEKAKMRQTAISILRNISIRMPLLIYGAELKREDEEITIDNFADKIDRSSWAEFMPKGVTKKMFNNFKRYYDADIFRSAGKRIREMARAADNLTVEERIERITNIFSTFRNPDKETVLTPWRVVNMHIADTLGGYCFYDEKYEHTLREPRFVEQGNVTAGVFATDARILEINSKTGLYPLYMAYGIYRARLKDNTLSATTPQEQQAVWDQVVKENIFVVCKTPMARSITRRTLVGFRAATTNTCYMADLVNLIKNKPKIFMNRMPKGRTFWKTNNDNNMKFNAVVGNPPYQIMDGGGAGTSAINIYNYFVDIAKKLEPQYISMIIPARWYAGGKGLDNFRESMLKDNRMKLIIDYPNPKDCFPTANISGGVCYFLWDKAYSGDCLFTNIVNGESVSAYRVLDEYEVFVRYNMALPIIKKVKSDRTIKDIVYARNPFNLHSSERGESEPSNDNQIKVYTSKGIGYLNTNSIKANQDLANNYKLLMGKVLSGHLGETDDKGQVKVITTLQVAAPSEVSTDSYLVIGMFGTKEAAENLMLYFRTKFLRFLLLQSLVSMNISRNNFRFVPLQDFTSGSDIDWSKSVPEIDRQLYAKYGLSAEEIDFIERMIKPM